MDKNDKAVKNIRQFLKDGKYKFTEKQKDSKFVFILSNTFGSSIYVNVWHNNNDDSQDYNLLIEEIYPSCRHSILKSIGQKYCSSYGNYEIGKYDLVSADNIVGEVEKTFNEKERFCKEFIREE